MTINRAIKELQLGNKVKHASFMPSQFVTLIEKNALADEMNIPIYFQDDADIRYALSSYIRISIPKRKIKLNWKLWEKIN